MEQKGSFIGFTFGNVHSSKLGILRACDSSRYEMQLTSPIQDVLVNLETIDGQYYYGSKYTSRELTIPFAFYGMTDFQLSRLKQILNDKKIHPLILDEDPYKVWSAKLTGTAISKHTCFENNKTRFYCGEGSFTFIAYYPFARSRYQYLEEYVDIKVPEWIEEGSILLGDDGTNAIYPAILQYNFDENEDTASLISFETDFQLWLEEMELLIDTDKDLFGINSAIQFFKEPGIYNNFEEWRETSKIPSNKDYGQYNGMAYKLYNAGDIRMPFKAFFPSNIGSVYMNCDGKSISLSGVTPKKGDSYIVIDGWSQTIYGCDANYNKTKNTYNEKITGGTFFDLPLGEIELVTNMAAKLEYNYLYL